MSARESLRISRRLRLFFTITGTDWPWTENPYTGRAHPVDWFMWHVAALVPGREVRLPSGHTSWKVTEDDLGR